jgi:gamma-glutamyltranspeptidase / glutathione hydrolase
MAAPPSLAIAAPNRDAVGAGARIAEQGGNAVDAVIASLVVALVNEPGVASLGGSAFFTIEPADRSWPVTIDGAVTMPGRGVPDLRAESARTEGLRDVVLGYGGGTAMSVGHGSVGTPGALAAIEAAHAGYGRLPWAAVLAPAIEVAEAGFRLGAAAAAYLDHVRNPVFGWHPQTTSALHHPDGRPVLVGEWIRIPGLSDFLRSYAGSGSSAFYRGPVAEQIEAEMADCGGLLTAADLIGYQPVVRPALSLPTGRWRLATNPPPSIGGAVLAAMLLLMSGRPETDWTLDDLAHLVAVQQAVLQHRADHLDESTEREVAATALLDGVLAGGQGWLRSSPSTLNVSAVDVEGTACAVTASAGYGSGVPAADTGIWLNNCLGEHELNRSGLHELPVGARLASNMAPTVGRRDDGAVLAIGSPGADRITTSILQVLAPLVAAQEGGPGWQLDTDLLQRLVDRPRLHVRLDDPGGRCVVDHEPDLTPILTGVGGLAGRVPGLGWCQHAEPMYFGAVGVAGSSVAGGLCAAADARRHGAAAVC